MKQYNTNVSREEVAALLNYDPQTGLFTHKVNGHKRKAGAVTGRLDTEGYVRVRLLGYDGKRVRLGAYDTVEEATAAYGKAKAELHTI